MPRASSLHPRLNTLDAPHDFGHRISIEWLMLDGEVAGPVRFDEVSNEFFDRHDSFAEGASVMRSRGGDVLEMDREEFIAQAIGGFEGVEAVGAAPAGVE